ncbi:hypothetical protein AALA98_13830 [Lachnospiraceae bacterium 45-W7]
MQQNFFLHTFRFLCPDGCTAATIAGMSWYLPSYHVFRYYFPKSADRNYCQYQFINVRNRMPLPAASGSLSTLGID